MTRLNCMGMIGGGEGHKIGSSERPPYLSPYDKLTSWVKFKRAVRRDGES